VPTYNPTVVYGTWPYPAYPPYYYYPPGYVAGATAFSFMAGVAVGAAWGYAWGGCNWGHGEIDIDVDRNVNFNQNINRENYRNDLSSRSGATATSAGKGAWQHDASHRRGVTYRDSATAQRYQKATTGDAQARQQFRGFAESGRQDLSRDGGQAAREQISKTGAGAKPSAATRDAPAKQVGQQPKPMAFDSIGNGSDVKTQSNRGSTSRQSSPSPTVRSGGASQPSPAVRSGGGARAGGGARGGRR